MNYSAAAHPHQATGNGRFDLGQIAEIAASVIAMRAIGMHPTAMHRMTARRQEVFYS
ncbi:hypothetical protein [Stenotrophomonas sp. PS02289]|uniref:hypothetical protein n=1 Tax=Stenotrophomonas sp. PS02289 TaxID=2991422 RepID=UPI00249CEE06|nr:hypothetical protein [Stenotrophomonas sp. PS02289]